MKKIRIIAAIAAVALAISVYVYLDSLKKPPVEAPRSPVVVAKAAIHSGDIIREDMVSVVSLPTEAVINGAARTTDEVVGRIANRGYEANEQLLVSQFLKAGEAGGGLSYVVQDGMRAITIPVDAISGVAGMIKPRNRVDLLVSLDLTLDATDGPSDSASASAASTAATPEATPTPTPAATGSAPAAAATSDHKAAASGAATGAPPTPAPVQKHYSVVAMQNILVLAVSQNTDSNSDTGRDAAAGAGTITLQVTPEQAQKLNLAASLAGTIRLTLRSALDTKEQDLPPMDESVFYK